MSRVAAVMRMAAIVLVIAIVGLGLGGRDVTRAAAARADVCLALVPSVLTEGTWDAVAHSVERVVSEREALFPDPAFDVVAPDTAAAHPAMQIHITADVSGPAPSGWEGDCLDAGSQWSLRVARQFLGEGAGRMLAAAPTTPGIASSVAVEWFPHESLVQTMLTFAGPLDIPNGRCWIDDVLSVDAVAGVAVSSAGHGLETSPFAEGACGRFFDYLVNGGAGEQALRLLPSVVPLADGSSLFFMVEEVSVRADAIVISGSLERD